MVPVMAVLYGLIIIVLLLLNIKHFSAFVESVVVGAFKPDAIFGGGFGIVLSQGIKRGIAVQRSGTGNDHHVRGCSRAGSSL